MGEPGDLYRELRRLVGYPNPTEWATAFGSFGKPVPVIERVPKLGSEYWETPGANARVAAVVPLAAISDDSDPDHTFGNYGGQVLPGSLPDNFSELPVLLRTNDGTALPVDATNPIAIIPITKDYKLSVWRTASVESGAITVLFKKNGTTFATLTQAAGTTGSGTFAETTLTTGDVVTVFITANAGNIITMGANVAGNKHWPLFPTPPNPGA
jgi:hypothetical protein